MARQPDIQYIQIYNYGSTAKKLATQPQRQKQKYQLPEQRPQRQQAKQIVLDPLSVCAIAVACFMLVTMLVGMLRVSELAGDHQALDSYIGTLREERANLQQAYESSYDLVQVEQRARQMGLVYPNEVYHVPMGTVTPLPQEEVSFVDQVVAFFDELFAKAPR